VGLRTTFLDFSRDADSADLRTIFREQKNSILIPPLIFKWFLLMLKTSQRTHRKPPLPVFSDEQWALKSGCQAGVGAGPPAGDLYWPSWSCSPKWPREVVIIEGAGQLDTRA
jgi:hypothetical protein